MLNLPLLVVDQNEFEASVCTDDIIQRCLKRFGRRCKPNADGQLVTYMRDSWHEVNSTKDQLDKKIYITLGKKCSHTRDAY